MGGGGKRSKTSSVAVATDMPSFLVAVCVAASVAGRLETTGVEMESDEELEYSSLVRFSMGSGILDGDMSRPAMLVCFSSFCAELVDFSGDTFEVGSGGFGS